MESAPRVCYARSGDINIAYCRWGGESDDVVLFTPSGITNVELAWELPEWERPLRRAGRFVEHIMMDKRGMGLSDRVPTAPTLEDHVCDILAVLDHAGIERAHIAGFSEGGLNGAACAALHPDRVVKLAMVGTPAMGVPLENLAEFAKAGDSPVPSPKQYADMWREIIRTWGSADSEMLRRMSASIAEMPHVRAWTERFERQSASPGTLVSFLRAQVAYDIRGYAAAIKVPTLVAHASSDPLVHPVHGRWFAANVPGAQYWEWPGRDHAWWLAPDWETIQNRFLEFLLDREIRSDSASFATVVFTDIVDSTRRAAASGNRAWDRLLDMHGRLCRTIVERAGGRVVKGTGDGILAVFNDPLSGVEAALELNRQLAAADMPVRVGVHSGQIEHRPGGDVSGLAVNIAARVEAIAGAGEVMVSRTVRDLLLGSAVHFAPRGGYELKGVDGKWELFAATVPHEAQAAGGLG